MAQKSKIEWTESIIRFCQSALDRCLGKGADWRTIINNTPGEKRAEKLRELYVSQLKKLGYTEFEYERISDRKHPLYILIFCSRHEFAAKLWCKISGIKPDGQRTFKF